MIMWCEKLYIVIKFLFGFTFYKPVDFFPLFNTYQRKENHHQNGVKIDLCSAVVIIVCYVTVR